jgi:stage II sporulation protein D
MQISRRASQGLLMTGTRAKAIRGGAATVALVLAGVTGGAVGGPASAATVTQTISVPSTDTHLTVTYRGNGHGHGMSQYGALGAAKAGLLYPAILFFYYPKTVLTQVSATARIRVRISNVGTRTTVSAARHLAVTGVTGELPVTGVARYRLIANSASGLTLQKLPSTTGAAWQNVKTGLPNKAAFSRTNGSTVRIFHGDGSSTTYYGTLRAVRASATGTTGGVYTVNRVSYDAYAQSVVAQEVSTSWPAAAVDAQAVAARTYGDYAVHHPRAPTYDICDTSSCQVYAGHARYTKDGTATVVDYAKAATDTSFQVLGYNGGQVFAEYSASNGGWTVAGGQPYLVAKQDPYDIATYDPYINKKTSVTVHSLTSEFGLATLKQIVLVRDGNGTWGGRVLSGTLSGRDSAGNAKQVAVTGYDLQGAFGLGTTWFQVAPAA